MRKSTFVRLRQTANHFISLVLLLILLLSTKEAFAQSQRLIKIRNVATGFILEIPNASPSTGGASLTREGWYCVARSDINTANQQWTIGEQEYYNALTTTNPNYECQFANRNSGQVLSIDIRSYANSSYSVVQYSPNNSGASGGQSRWQLKSHYDPNRNLFFFSIINAVGPPVGTTGRFYLMPVSRDALAKVVGVQQSEADFLNNPLSQWEILDITNSIRGQPQPAPFFGSCTFTNPASGRVLQVYKQNCNAGTPVEIGNYIGITSQQWVISNHGTSTPSINSPVKIINRLCGLALQVVGQSTADGASLETGEFIGVPSQLWLPIQIGSNWAFKNVNSGYVMQIIDASTADGARLQQGNLVPVPQQLWAVASVSSLRMQAPPTALAESITSSSASVYPNPTKEKLTVIAPDCQKICALSIVDAHGKIIEQLASFNQDEQLDVSHLAQGVYCLLLNDGTHSFTLKFVKE